MSLSQIITNLVRFVFSKNFDRVSISCTQFSSRVFFSFTYILQGISLFNFQGPLRTSQPSVAQFFGITSLFLSDIFVSLFKHWSTLPTYPFALSSDSIIISQFSSFVKSFFCELSVNRFPFYLRTFGVRILLGSARLFLSLSGVKVYHKISFLSIPFLKLLFSSFFSVFPVTVCFFLFFRLYDALKFGYL